MDESGFGTDEDAPEPLTKVDAAVLLGIVVFVLFMLAMVYFEDFRLYLQI